MFFKKMKERIKNLEISERIQDDAIASLTREVMSDKGLFFFEKDIYLADKVEAILRHLDLEIDTDSTPNLKKREK